MTTPVQATKKPVTISAMLWDGSSSEAGEIIEWINSNGGSASFKEVNETPEHIQRIEVTTLEGRMAARPGDWIIKGVKDEFYPCKPDIFDQTYDYPSTK